MYVGGDTGGIASLALSIETHCKEFEAAFQSPLPADLSELSGVRIP